MIRISLFQLQIVEPPCSRHQALEWLTAELVTLGFSPYGMDVAWNGWRCSLDVFFSRDAQVLFLEGVRLEDAPPSELMSIARPLAHETFCILERRGLQVDYVPDSFIWGTDW